MPWKVRFAIIASCLLHLLLIFALSSLGYYLGKVTVLDDSGGVVWFNLHPGGLGSGGTGGSGAPRDAKENSDQEAKPEAKAVQENSPSTPPKPHLSDDSEIKAHVKKTKETKPKVGQGDEATAPQKNTTVASIPSHPFPGPGEGDGEGSQSGSGQGDKQGLGAGHGSGQGNEEGPGGVGEPGTGGSGKGGQGSNVLGKIRQKILQAKRYPPMARSQGIEGVCGLSFEIEPDGHVERIQLTQSSGHSILDNEAVATVKRASPFPFYPGAIRFSLKFNLKDE